MPMMEAKDVHAALRSAGMIGQKGQETAQLRGVLESQGLRLGQLHNIYVSKKGSIKRPFPHLILLAEEVNGSVREYFHVVISPEYKVIENKRPHKARKATDDKTRFYGGGRENLNGMNNAD